MASRVFRDPVLRDIDKHFAKANEMSDHAYRRILAKLTECDKLLAERQPEPALQEPTPAGKGGRRS